MVEKIFVTAQSLLSDSFRLGLKIMDDGFHREPGFEFMERRRCVR